MVGLCVLATSINHPKMAKLIEMPSGGGGEGLTRVRPQIHVLDRRGIFPNKEVRSGNFRGCPPH